MLDVRMCDEETVHNKCPLKEEREKPSKRRKPWDMEAEVRIRCPTPNSTPAPRSWKR